ncbi:hypothetical protein LPJ61_005901 [Coemansia biformis]|uniref:Uncharacterized protein n=1 Tax=Coemansia biformis TaxID=1286918 RepID=A0A9W7Y2B9_9FUNG|nr:hypothetical protein LPJ61_005901 [Coemansia biformis]
MMQAASRFGRMQMAHDIFDVCGPGFTNPYNLDPFIWTWLHELANQYHREQESGRWRRGGSDMAPGTSPVSPAQPWLPTLATHYIMLTHLDRHGATGEIADYFYLLTSVWGQYRQWATRHDSKEHGGSDGDGLQRLERLVVGHMAQDVVKARDVYGLGQYIAAPAESAPSGTAGVASTHYYAHCDQILALAQGNWETHPTGQAAASRSDRPPRVVYGKALHGHALEGDIQSMLHHMQRFPGLNDIAVWSSVVRCICVQIALHPDDRLMLHPQLYGKADPEGSEPDSSHNWLDLIFDLARVLAAQNVYFTQVTFGMVVQLAAQLGDMHSILRATQFMHTNYEVRFNADMLMMTIRMDLPFDTKCVLVQSMLDRYTGQGRVKPADSTAKMSFAALSLLVRSAQTPEDAIRLRSIVESTRTTHGIVLQRSEIEHLRQICLGSEAWAGLQSWIDANSILHTHSSAKPIDVPGGGESA